MRRMGTCICKAEFLCRPPETTITLLLGYSQIQNKKLKKKVKKIVEFLDIHLFEQCYYRVHVSEKC